MSLCLVPISLDEANEFVRLHHRHHRAVPGCKFSLAVARSFALRCDGSDACKCVCRKTAVHAEQMAILQAENVHDAQMLHVKTVNGDPVVSGAPSCLECSKLILEAGIKFMWLWEPRGLVRYSAEKFHEETLRFHGMKVTHV